VTALALDMEERAAIQFATPGGVVLAESAHVRRKERIQAQFFAQGFAGNFNPRRHKKDGRMRICHDMFDDAIAARRIGIDETIVERAFFGIFEFVFEIPVLFVAKRLAVSN